MIGAWRRRRLSSWIYTAYACFGLDLAEQQASYDDGQQVERTLPALDPTATGRGQDFGVESWHGYCPPKRLVTVHLICVMLLGVVSVVGLPALSRAAPAWRCHWAISPFAI